MGYMSCHVLIIGDEILSGRRHDKHMEFVCRTLPKYKCQLQSVTYLPDDFGSLVGYFRSALTHGELTLSFGGIGATPDDQTRQSIAHAAHVPLEYQKDALKLIEERFGDEAWPHRVKMAEFPQGSLCIPNPINQVAGCSFMNIHAVPGFPSMAHPMVEWVLNQHTQANDIPPEEIMLTLVVPNVREGDLIAEMEEWVKKYPSVRFSSLPSMHDQGQNPSIEFGFTGIEPIVQEAYQEWIAMLTKRGIKAWR
jgi:molybdopterin-biosynthesis enzyme MoeA-like protein